MEEPAVQSANGAAAEYFVQRNVSCQAAWQVDRATTERMLTLNQLLAFLGSIEFHRLRESDCVCS